MSRSFPERLAITLISVVRRRENSLKRFHVFGVFGTSLFIAAETMLASTVARHKLIKTG